MSQRSPGIFVASLLMLAAPVRAQCEKASFPGSAGPLGGGISSFVDLEGGTCVVGTPQVASGVQGVYVFAEQGGSWVEEALITRTGPTDVFMGHAVALDGDLLALGSPHESFSYEGREGAVALYRRGGGGWSLEQLVVAAVPDPTEGFGGALALDGGTLAVAGHRYPFGGLRVHVFGQEPGPGWVEQATLVASDWAGPIGGALALQGDRLLVGASRANPGPTGAAGEAYLFERSGTTWTETQRLFRSGSDTQFGQAVAIDGSTLAVAAYEAVYVFVEQAGSWVQQARLVVESAYALSLVGDRLLVGDPRSDDAAHFAGAVQVFVRSGTAWTHADTLYGHDVLAEQAQFGLALAADETRVVTVAPYTHRQAYVFEFDDPDCPETDFAGTPTSGIPPFAVDFTDQSGGNVTSWSWNFGDGALSSEQDPQHTYGGPGRYTVDLVTGGPSGFDREIKPRYILGRTAASATVRNGSGINPLCLASTSLPVIGGTWTAEIDTTGHPGATFTVLRGCLNSGQIPYHFGELLVFPEIVFARLVLPDGWGIARYAFAIPNNLALDARVFYTQGAIFGGGVELCNAVDLLAGY
jgi:hypothetical protein